MGCRGRGHLLGLVPSRSGSAAYPGVSQSHAGSAASDARKERHQRQVKKYRELIGIAEEVVNSARKALQQTRKARRKDLVTAVAIGELRKEIDHYCKLL